MEKIDLQTIGKEGIKDLLGEINFLILEYDKRPVPLSKIKNETDIEKIFNDSVALERSVFKQKLNNILDLFKKSAIQLSKEKTSNFLGEINSMILECNNKSFITVEGQKKHYPPDTERTPNEMLFDIINSERKIFKQKLSRIFDFLKEDTVKEGIVSDSIQEHENLESKKGFKEIIYTKNILILKPKEDILKNHYGENLIPIEITKDSYSIKELVDLGYITKFDDSKYRKERDIDYEYIIPFDNSDSTKYYKNLGKDDYFTIIKVSKESDNIEGLEEYWNAIGGNVRLKFITDTKVNINDISKEILDLIPEDFGKYDFENASAFNSLYFTNEKGQVCRISDHRLPPYSEYPNFMVYSILIGQTEEANAKSQ